MEVIAKLTIKPIRFKRPAVVNTDLFETSLKPKFFNTNNTLAMFPHRKRCRLEQAMLIYGSHIMYLSAVLEKPLTAFMANRSWASYWFPQIWESALKKAGLNSKSFVDAGLLKAKMEDLSVSVDADLFAIFGELYDNRIFNQIKKGKRNER